MKKLLLIALALNFVACSNDNTENATTPITVAKSQTFNPEPSPNDYLNAKYSSFMQNIEDISTKKSSLTAKTASFISTYVPDAAFRTRLINLGAAQDAVPGDNYVEIDNTRVGLDLSGASINDLTGIKSFTFLYQLVVSGNNLTSLDVSGMSNLGILECQYNQLTTLNLSTNTGLTQIWCYNNLINSLNLPTAPNLWGVWCYGNKLTTLNLNSNTNITDLFIQGNQLTSFNFAPFIKLKQTNVSTNKWTTLNFNSNPALVSLWCFSNTLLTDMTVKNGTNYNIINQDFRSNSKAPKIHVDNVEYANFYWPNKGSSTYVF